jgi:hypothetical protein
MNWCKRSSDKNEEKIRQSGFDWKIETIQNYGKLCSDSCYVVVFVVFVSSILLSQSQQWDLACVSRHLAL